MEIFYGIKINAAIKVRMTDARTIAKHFGEDFVPTPGVDGRVLGFAQKDASGYSLYIENGLAEARCYGNDCSRTDSYLAISKLG